MINIKKYCKTIEDRGVLKWSITYVDKNKAWGIIVPVIDKRGLID